MPKVRILCHVNYQNPWIHFSRSIDEYILYYIISGELYIKEAATQYTLSRGDYLILEPNIEHTGYKSSCCHYFYVHFRDEGMSKVPEINENELLEKMVSVRKESLESDIYKGYNDKDSKCYLPKRYHLNQEDRFNELLYRANSDFYMKTEHYKSSAACQFLNFLIKAGQEFADDQISKGGSSWPKAYAKVNQIKKFLETNYKLKITSSLIESEFEMSYDYLNKVFHKFEGFSIYNYLNLVRINKAKEYIQTTDMKYSEIACHIGIDDPFYFSKLFKKYTGLSPSQYWQKYNALLDSKIK